MADVLGALVEQWKLGQTVTEADWLVGREILAPGVTGKALRSLAEPGSAYDDDVPGKDPQPAHVSAFLTTDDDNGGVHINSGISNRAFTLVATRLGGKAWEDAGRIWYASLGHDRLLPTAISASWPASRGMLPRRCSATTAPRCRPSRRPGAALESNSDPVRVSFRRSGGIVAGAPHEIEVEQSDLDAEGGGGSRPGPGRRGAGAVRRLVRTRNRSRRVPV